MVDNPPTLPNVFIAEDDDDDFFIFSLAMEDITAKIALKRARNGSILMQMLEENPIPDFLFLDLLMPRKDGIQCLREIRSNRRYDSVCVIVYSSLATLYHTQLCYQEKANAFIEKPFSVDALKGLFQMIFSMDWKAGMPKPPMKEFVMRQ